MREENCVSLSLALSSLILAMTLVNMQVILGLGLADAVLGFGLGLIMKPSLTIPPAML